MIRTVSTKLASSLMTRKISTLGCNRLKGKVAVVTASTEGIGFAIAQRLAEEGAKVVISSRKEANVKKALEQFKEMGLTSVLGTVCHVGNASDRTNLLKKAEETFGGIDILVSNAAVNPTMGNVLDCPEDAWDKIFDINVKSAFMLTKEVVPYMRKRCGGAIVYVTSIAGFQPINALGAYSVSKTAILGLTKAVALDVASDNIRVNGLAPGIVRTKFSSALTTSEGAQDAILGMVPLGRFATPDEMAGTVAFLCSEDASYITGETIIAGGGMPSRL